MSLRPWVGQQYLCTLATEREDYQGSDPNLCTGMGELPMPFHAVQQLVFLHIKRTDDVHRHVGETTHNVIYVLTNVLGWDLAILLEKFTTLFSPVSLRVFHSWYGPAYLGSDFVIDAIEPPLVLLAWGGEKPSVYNLSKRTMPCHTSFAPSSLQNIGDVLRLARLLSF